MLMLNLINNYQFPSWLCSNFTKNISVCKNTEWLKLYKQISIYCTMQNRCKTTFCAIWQTYTPFITKICLAELELTNENQKQRTGKLDFKSNGLRLYFQCATFEVDKHRFQQLLWKTNIKLCLRKHVSLWCERGVKLIQITYPHVSKIYPFWIGTDLLTQIKTKS